MSTDVFVADTISPPGSESDDSRSAGVASLVNDSGAAVGLRAGQGGRHLGRRQIEPAGGCGPACGDARRWKLDAASTELRNDRSFAEVASDYVQLTKPRIVVMILVTTVASAVIAGGGLLAPTELLALLVGTGMVAASAGAANQVWERVVDGRMPRTASRPLPDGRLTCGESGRFTAMLGVAGVAILGAMFGIVPAAVGAGTWLLYVLVYTPLKTRTAWNTTVGAVAGALPILIGYTAAGGGLGDAEAWLLFGVLAAWQYPHFMAIAWIYRRQYAEAGFRMTTTEEPSGRSAAMQSVVGSLAVIVFGMGLSLLPGGLMMGSIAALTVLAAVYPMLRASLRFGRHPGDLTARSLLRASLLVLPLVLAVATLRVFW
jgi:protoheme IX farnesyltransferase